MPINITCPSCDRKLKVPDALVGKKAKCPSCGTVLQVPDSEPEPVYEPDPVEEDDGIKATPPKRGSRRPREEPEEEEDDRRPCPACGEMIKRAAVKCRYCGEIFDETLKRAEKKKKRRSGGGGGADDSDLTGADLALAILCSGIGCIMGIVWLIQGKPKGGKMLGLSLLFVVIWNVVRFAVEASLRH